MHIQEYLENDTCCNLSSFIIYFSVQLLNETQDGARCMINAAIRATYHREPCNKHHSIKSPCFN